MVEQDVAFAQLREDVGTVGRKAQFTRHESFEFQFGPLNLIKIKEPGKVYRTLRVEDLPILKLKGLLQPPGDFSIRVGVNLQAHRIAFAPPVQLCPYGLKQVS